MALKPTIISTASQYNEGFLVEPDSPSLGLVPQETSLNKELTNGGFKLMSFHRFRMMKGDLGYWWPPDVREALNPSEAEVLPLLYVLQGE